MPEGARPGDVIEFNVGAPAAAAGAGASAPSDVVRATLHWQANAKRSASRDEMGLSNAVVDTIYSVVLPAGHEGDTISAELSAGGPVLCVPVPAGARVGDPVLFKPPLDGEDVVVDVLHKGLLSKKSPKGVIGMHKWQTRWFELQPSHLAYWESGPPRVEPAAPGAGARRPHPPLAPTLRLNARPRRSPPAQ